MGTHPKRIWSFFLSIALSIFSFSQPKASSLPPPKVDVLIIGSGLAGLSTAYRLKKLGITSRILEASPHIGGRVRRTAPIKRGPV